MKAIRSRRTALYDDEGRRHVLKDVVVTFSEKTGKIVDVLEWEQAGKLRWRIEEPEGGHDELHLVCCTKEGEEESETRMPLTDAGNAILMPGLVDISTSVSDPGPRSWGTFESVSRVAASGGVTTILDLPVFNSSPTTTLEAFDAKLEAARGKLYVDCGFTAGLTSENMSEVAGESQVARRGKERSAEEQSARVAAVHSLSLSLSPLALL